MGRIVVIAFPLMVAVMLSIVGHCEMSIYPGLRRKPLQQALQQPFDVSSDFWAQLMEENARKRLQQQFEQQLELIKMQMSRQRQRERQERLRERYRQQQLQALAENEDDEYSNNNINANLNTNNENNNANGNNNQFDDSNPDFSYRYRSSEIDGSVLKEPITFAVGPSDPRYYAKDIDSNEDDSDLDTQVLDDYEEYVPAETKQTTAAEKPAPAAHNTNDKDNTKQSVGSAPILAPNPPVDGAAAATTTFHRIKPQTAAAAAVAGVASIKPLYNGVSGAAATNTREDINALFDKLQKQGKSNAILNTHELGAHDEHIVVRQHLGIDGDTGMYVVALIAGVSAAVTVGLIAIGFAWLHNKTKAAADVEYPAYGVTGPNKDISPSGDRKLAQSAQMYHYQHQKQQIIAMENRQAAEGSCGLSDVESDDDNEEGDYTVYECPGLAPTGEMEVKNPLFLDETPLTPSSNATTGTTTTGPASNNLTQATPQQPQQTNKKTSGKAAGNNNNTNVTSSDEKKKKNKK